MSQDNKYNLNGLWRLYSQTGNETLSLSVYNSTASIVVFKKGTESRKPSVKLNLSLPALHLIGNLLKLLKDAQPNTRQPFVSQKFDKDSREYRADTSFIFFKDDKRCYGIEISNKFIPTPIKFIFRAPATFSKGSEPLSDEQKSLLGLEEFLYWVDVGLPQAMLLSRFNMDLVASGGGNINNNNRGHSNTGNSNGYQKQNYSNDSFTPNKPISNPDTNTSAFE